MAQKKWRGVHHVDKRMNKNISMGILAVLFLQGIGVFGWMGQDLSTTNILGAPVLTVLLIFGSGWMIWGLNKKRIGG